MLYEQLPFWIGVVVAFIVIITKIELLTSRLIKEKAAAQANLVEAFNELDKERANLVKKGDTYFLQRLGMKKAEREFRKILLEEKDFLQLQHQQLESDILSEHNAEIAALEAKYDFIARKSEARIKALGDENSRLGKERDTQVANLNTEHAETLQKAAFASAGELRAIAEDNDRLKKEIDDLNEALARTAMALGKEKKDSMQKGPGAEEKTARIIQDLQDSIATAEREAQDWRTEAYNVIVRGMLPSQRGLSLFNNDVCNFSMPPPLSNPPSSLHSASAVDSNGNSNTNSSLAPRPPPGLAVGPNGHSKPPSSLFAPSQASLNPLAPEFWISSDSNTT